MKNRLLVITGASRGIGRETAALFCRAGYSVLNLSRSECDLAAAINIEWDLASVNWPESSLELLCEEASKAEEICLIHNAALHEKDNIDTVSAEDLRRVLEVNVVAPQRLNAVLLPFMKEGSSILYVGSTLAEKAVANAYSYVVSKHCGVGMMKANSQDLIGRGIHTANVCPGFTDTEMLRTHVGDDPAVVSALSEMSAFGRLIQPEEIAKTLLFCAENSVIGGSVIHANLGQVEH